MRFVRGLLPIVTIVCATSALRAHFVWLALEPAKDSKPPEARVYFGELAHPDSAELLDRLKRLEVWHRAKSGEYAEVKLAKVELEDGSALAGTLPAGATCIEADCSYGTFSRGQKKMLLHYYAKALGPGAGETLVRSKRLALDLVPSCAGGALKLEVIWMGKPASGAMVTLLPQKASSSEVETDASGVATFQAPAPGKYEARARVIEAPSGEIDGEKYEEARHYITLTFEVPGPAAAIVPAAATAAELGPEAAAPSTLQGEVVRYTELPRGITSFGAAVIGDWIYVYGGHHGRPHSYSNKSQSETLTRLNLKAPGAWEVVAQGPGLQGLAMAAHAGKLYRIGGLKVENEEGKDHDLRSVDDFVCFDPASGQWAALQPLPEPRSSHDAVVIGDKIYVVGGWQLKGAEKRWHTNAWMIDLSAAKGETAWQKLPDPPFRRRALSLGHLGGKLLAIGGMQEEGEATTRVDVLDLATGAWSEGPSLPGEGMEGFGSSAYTAGNRLFVSTHGGNLLCLDAVSAPWKLARKLNQDRFFHRMVSHGEELLLVGGASMTSGKRLGFEAVALSQLDGERPTE